MQSLFRAVLLALVLAAWATPNGFAQTFAPTPKRAGTAEIQELTKKIDEQNAKIDMLSQQILKLQMAIDHQRPGVMIGESGPSASTSTSTTSTSTSASPEPSA